MIDMIDMVVYTILAVCMIAILVEVYLVERDGNDLW